MNGSAWEMGDSRKVNFRRGFILQKYVKKTIPIIFHGKNITQTPYFKQYISNYFEKMNKDIIFGKNSPHLNNKNQQGLLYIDFGLL